MPIKGFGSYEWQDGNLDHKTFCSCVTTVGHSNISCSRVIVFTTVDRRKLLKSTPPTTWVVFLRILRQGCSEALRSHFLHGLLPAPQEPRAKRLRSSHSKKCNHYLWQTLLSPFEWEHLKLQWEDLLRRRVVLHSTHRLG